MFESFRYSLLAVLALVGCSESEPVAADADPGLLAQAKGAILRADGAEALNLLAQVDAAELSPEDQAYYTCAIPRLRGTDLDGAEADTSPLVQNLLAIYRTYWKSAMMNGADLGGLEQELGRTLSIAMGVEDVDALEAVIIDRLSSEGLYALMGRTGQLRDLMIWTSQKKEQTTVRLPEGEVSTTLFYLDDFISTGWSSYFNCDTVGTGGWAKPDGLYVVVPRWEDLDDERFRVSLLAHESQHFLDYSRFPDLQGWELEYRAKLVELALAETIQEQLVDKFVAHQGDNKADAHSYANRKVVADLREYLGLAEQYPLAFDSPLAVQEAAAALLHRDSTRRSDTGASD